MTAPVMPPPVVSEPVVSALLPAVARHLPPGRHATGVVEDATGAHLPVVCERIERDLDGVAFVSRVPFYVVYAEGEPAQHESPAAFQALVRAGRAWYVDSADARPTSGRPELGRPEVGGVVMVAGPLAERVLS